MISDFLLPHRVQPMVSVASTDGYGNPVRRPGAPGLPVPAYVQPLDSTEDTTEGQVREARWRVFLGPEVNLDAWSHVVWEGREYEPVGDPLRHDTPDGAHHQVLIMRRVGA